MGAHKHPTTRVGDENQRHRLKRDLRDVSGVERVRDNLVCDTGVVVETDENRLTPEMVRVLASHGASVTGYKKPHEPFEVFL